MPVRKILLKGYFGFANLGDDLLLVTTYSLLREAFPTAAIDVFSNNTINNTSVGNRVIGSEYLAHLLNDENVRVVDWKSTGSYDLVVNGGGGIYFDYRNGGWKHGLLNRVGRLFTTGGLRRIESAFRKISGRRFRQTFQRRYGLGIGVEKFHAAAPSYVRKKADLGTFDAIFVRDENSRQNLSDLKYDGKVHVSTDNVFLHRYWMPSSVKAERVTAPTRLGVILMDWPDFDGIFKNCFDGIRILRDRGWNVTFFSFDANHDRKYLDFLSRANEDVIVWNPVEQDLKAFIDVFAQQHVVLTARAHGAIVGATLGIPAICIGFREKLATIHRMLHKSSTLLQLPIGAGALVDIVTQMKQSYGERSARVVEDLRRNEALAEEGLTTFLSLVRE